MPDRRLAKLLAAVLFFAAIYAIRIREDMVDFSVNHQAGARFAAGEELYRTSDGHFMFKYFPISAALYAPLTFFPLEVAKVFWYAFIVACAVLAFRTCGRLVSGGEPRRWPFYVLPPLILAKFCLRELKLGQINLVVTLVLLMMTASLLAGRRGRAGLLWGIATALKPYGLIFLPYWVVTRNLAALGAGLAVLAAGFLAPSLRYGVSGNLALHRSWFETLSASTPDQLAVADNVSFAGALTKWTGSEAFASQAFLVVLAALAGLILWAILRGRGLPRPALFECALLLTLIPLVSPLGWDYQLLTSMLAVTLLIDRFPELPARAVLGLSFAVIALSIYDLMGRSAYQAFMNASVLTVCYAVVLAYLFDVRARRLE